MREKKLKFCMVIIAGLMFAPIFSRQAAAACSRDDVDYYLSKGFSPEQITQLCTATTNNPQPPRQSNPDAKTASGSASGSDSASGSASGSTPDSTQDSASSSTTGSASQSALRREPGDPAKILAESIDGYQIDVTKNFLKYVRKVCVEYGEEDMFGFRPKACPEVLYSLGLANMKVLDTRKEHLIFGKNTITVEGRFSQKILSGLEGLREEDRGFITGRLRGDEKKLSIPVRKQVPLDRVVDSLEQLGAAHRDAASP